MLTPAQVVPFLQNPDPKVRDLAERYLTQAHDPSPATAEDAWRMIDHVGKGESHPSQYSIIAQLPQTEASLNRILLELTTEANETRRNYLEEALVKLPYGLLMRFRDRIEGAAGLSDDFRNHLAKRIELSSVPPQELWDQLMKLGEELMQNWDDAEGYDPRPAQLLTEALARSPESAQWAISTLNDESITDFREIFAVELLGQIRHRPAADLIADELISDEDSGFLLESSTDALIRIGGPQVVQAIQSRWKKMTPGFRLYACDVLSGVKLKEGEAALGEYLKSEPDLGIRTKIAISLCDTASNDPQVLEGLRQMINDGKWDMMMVDLDEDVVALFTMIGHDVPELPRWRAKLQDSDAIKKRRAKAFERFTHAGSSQLPALDDFDGDLQSWQQDDELGPRSPAPAAVKQIRRDAPKVGRNDPCPCGSGKKYKKCCGK